MAKGGGEVDYWSRIAASEGTATAALFRSLAFVPIL